MYCHFAELVQRIFKCGNIPNKNLTPDKELNILIYLTPSYVIIYRSYILSKMVRFFWPTLYVLCQRIIFESIDIGSCSCTWGISSLHALRVKFVYEGHRVTGAKMIANSYPIRSAITSVLSNIEPWCLRAAWGFRVRRIEWCNRHLCHLTGSHHSPRVTKCAHSRVVPP